jgi:hypothetical protein
LLITWQACINRCIQYKNKNPADVAGFLLPRID